MKTYKPFPGPCTLSLKLDGINATWTGSALISRGDLEIVSVPHINEELKRQFADEGVSGELYTDAMTFDEISGAVRRLAPSPKSGVIKFYPFYKFHKDFTYNDIVKPIPSEQVDHCDTAVLAYFLSHYPGAEGVVVIDESGNSSKYKPALPLDCVATGFSKPGKGKYEGQAGSIQLRSPSGISFYASGMSDLVRAQVTEEEDDLRGLVVEVNATGLTSKGTPRHPRVRAIRWDLPRALLTYKGNV